MSRTFARSCRRRSRLTRPRRPNSFGVGTGLVLYSPMRVHGRLLPTNWVVWVGRRRTCGRRESTIRTSCGSPGGGGRPSQRPSGWVWRSRESFEIWQRHCNISRVVPREHYLGRVRKALGRSPVVALFGPRQCGKTTLARQMMPAGQLDDAEREHVGHALGKVEFSNEFETNAKLPELIMVTCRHATAIGTSRPRLTTSPWVICPEGGSGRAQWWVGFVKGLRLAVIELKEPACPRLRESASARQTGQFSQTTMIEA